MKVWVQVDAGAGAPPHRVCWYVGTSDAMVENAIRMQLQLPRRARFLLRDADGDLVPVATTLPHTHTFQLVLVDDGEPPSRAPASAAMIDRPLRSTQKRRRVVAPEQQHIVTERTTVHDDDTLSLSDVAEPLADQAQVLDHSVVMTYQPSVTTPTRPRSIVYLVTRFLETFTSAISNDDNVNFIPSTGPYALYALYCHLFPHAVYHPKSPSGFYKMTSMQGKIDRQRVIRYYQCPVSRASTTSAADHGVAALLTSSTSNHAEEPRAFVVYKPEGKGPLLRKYVDVGVEVSSADLARAASFVRVLDLDPHAIVQQYMHFLEGFVPISKATYQSHAKDTHA